MADVASAVAARYDVAADRAEGDVARFAAELLNERLLVTATIVDAAAAGAAGAAITAAAREPYQAPRLHKYTDMADMLALDPPLPGLNDIPWKRSRTE